MSRDRQPQSSRRSASLRPFGLLFAALFAAGSLASGDAVRAQNPTGNEIPPAESKVLETKDGVQLQVAWFPGSLEKDSVPIILMHDWDGRGEDLGALASYLQGQGHAVIVPDLRGHGNSLRIRGNDDPIDRTKMNKLEIATMSEDLETCKRFLMEQNNQGKLNIELLTIVAAGNSTIVAIDWALKDWSWPAIAGRKQGQDVKALVLLSPVKQFKGLNINPAMRNPLLTGRGATPLSVLIAVGTRGGGAARDARGLYESMEKSRPALQLSGSEQDQIRQRLEQQDLFLQEYPVEFQGAALVDPRARLDLHEKILGFLNARLVAKADLFRWTDRTPPR